MLSDAQGDVSAVRVMAFTALIVGSFIGVYGVVNRLDLKGLAELTGVFIGAGFGAKVIQKHIEGKDL